MIKSKKVNYLTSHYVSNPLRSFLNTTYLNGSRLCRNTEINGQSQLTRSMSTQVSAAKVTTLCLRERFIQRLIVDGKKSVATKVFDESLQLLISYIKDHNSIAAKNQENLYSLMNLTKDEIFMIALRKAQP